MISTAELPDYAYWAETLVTIIVEKRYTYGITGSNGEKKKHKKL